MRATDKEDSLQCTWADTRADWTKLQESSELQELLARSTLKNKPRARARARVDRSKFSGERSHEVIALTKNARLHSTDKISNLLGELVQINAWDVVLFSETRRSGEAVDLEGAHRSFLSQCPTACAGVAILEHSKHVAAVQRVQAVDERVMYICGFENQWARISHGIGLHATCRISDGRNDANI